MSKTCLVGLGVSVAVSAALLTACSGSSSSEGSGGSSGAAGSGSGGSGGSGAGGGGGSGGSSGSAGGGAGGATSSCGSAGFCLIGTTCVEELFEPTCEGLSDPNGTCPAGKTKTFCGGAGGACCCDPPPDSKLACLPTTCSGPVDCSCITCPNGKMCMATANGPFQCAEPPKP